MTTKSTRDPRNATSEQHSPHAREENLGLSSGVTRLAPSPTGALHLGNARTFLINAALARQSAWRCVMRIEDLDSPRVKVDAMNQTLDVLAWLGLKWDGEPMIQSARRDLYVDAMCTLARSQHVFPSAHTRSDVEAAASAPHAGDHELRFPESLRPAVLPRSFEDTGDAWRLLVPDERVIVIDEIAGEQSVNPSEEVGDLVVWTKRGTASYQLAVVVDDAAQGVTDVVRGDDLLPSAARQQLIAERLGIASPRWWHVPLVLGPDGRRLAKRHGDTRIDSYRRAGVSAARIIGLCAYWCGVSEVREEITFDEFCDEFSLGTLLQRPVHFIQEDHAWLIDGSG